jgi:hypothetical protein
MPAAVAGAVIQNPVRLVVLVVVATVVLIRVLLQRLAVLILVAVAVAQDGIPIQAAQVAPES